MKIVYSSKCLEYREIGHPESPERIKEVIDFLKRKKDKNIKFIEPESAEEEDLLLAHTQNLVNQVKNETFFDQDTPRIKGIFDYASLSAGGAIKAMEISLIGEFAFSLMRPPGHHAGRDRLSGFCYFNNLAVAVAKALERVERVAILDFDCHHGNGTEDIFLGKSNLLYLSLHQYPFYPGTGAESNFNCLNFPLPAGTKEKEYLETLEFALKKISYFSPDLLALSAGFDGFKNDPLTIFGLEKESFGRIGEKIADLKLPAFAVLEGGYGQALPVCLYNFLLGMGQVG